MSNKNYLFCDECNYSNFIKLKSKDNQDFNVDYVEIEKNLIKKGLPIEI